jgi:hypothetical protein
MVVSFPSKPSSKRLTLGQNPQPPTWGGRAQKGTKMTGRDDIESGESNRLQLQGLPVIRGNVAGIDLGSERHWVCAPTLDGSRREIAHFGATTPEWIRMAKWLKERQGESVAMESTGVYWIAPTRGVGRARFAGVAGGHSAASTCDGTGQEDGRERLRLHSAAAQLRLAASLVPAGGNSMHVADAGAG